MCDGWWCAYRASLAGLHLVSGDVQDVFKEMDTNNDKKIVREEFISFIQRIGDRAFAEETGADAGYDM